MNNERGYMKTYWTCEGDVRGSCGVKHRSSPTAQECCEKDARDIRRAYPGTFPTVAYSDRVVVEKPGH